MGGRRGGGAKNSPPRLLTVVTSLFVMRVKSETADERSCLYERERTLSAKQQELGPIPMINPQHLSPERTRGTPPMGAALCARLPQLP